MSDTFLRYASEITVSEIRRLKFVLAEIASRLGPIDARLGG